MQWQSAGDFLNLGGYAAYVWPSFALALAVLFGLVWRSRAELRAAEAELAAAEAASGRRGAP